MTARVLRATPPSLCFVLLAPLVCLADNLAIVSHSPASSASNVPRGTGFVVTFDRPVDPATVNFDNIRVFGHGTGAIRGTFALSNGNQTVTLTPDRSFSAGDVVMVTLSHNLRGADNNPLRSAGYGYRFTTIADPATMSFTQIMSVSNRGTTPQTRIYGAIGSDLDNDGWLDLTTVNEVSSDLRIFMNRADGTGLYHNFMQPPETINFESSPNDCADFDNDGLVDVTVASSATSVVSVLLGHGDGTFGPQQTINVGSTPHGMATLDADGDGDMDIVTSNTGGNNCSIMFNNGAGVFGPATHFEGGGSGEYALGSADMNNDGIFDLVVGAQGNQRIVVQLGNGNGTFTQSSNMPAGGAVWMLGTSDVNNDGNEDVHTANSGSSNGSILLGNGAGAIGSPATYAATPQTVSTRTGDLDGDGDLDWVLSCFSGGQWHVYRNNGNGTFTPHVIIPAASNPACASILDVDNDHDLDLVLLDEIADLMRVYRNAGPLVDGDMNCDGSVDILDINPFTLALSDAAAYNAAYPNCNRNNADVNDDGSVDVLDINPFVALISGG
ncbi:FG-GAP repeat protein [Phycisphaerae bacterium RAS1]|nr:FG-GAP repeat protein [Phycisphaerae bacterium RAS1]